MWEHPWNRYADGGVLQEAELSHAQDSPPGPQWQPAASRPAAAGAAGPWPAGVRAAAAEATGGSGSGGVPGAGLSPGWRRAGARALTWPSRLVDLETQACQIVGDEFYDRLQSPETGLHPAQWLRALAEETGAALRAEIAQGADDWQKLWALLCGLALTAPRTPVEAVSEAARSAREMFPDIKDPRETTLAEAGKVARLLADRALEPGAGRPAGGSRPAGEPLAARDAYGSRLVLMAPFSYDGGAPDHWYAWDIDLCWIAVIVGAGVFASAQDALREWRDAAGPAACGAALSPCAAGMTARLLAPCLQTGVLADMLQGLEPRELIREYYRLRRRARDLTGSADTGADSSPFDAGHLDDAFLGWYAARHDDVPEAVAEATGTILSEWGPHENPDERSFYACSPHRIEMAAHLISEGYFAGYANARSGCCRSGRSGASSKADSTATPPPGPAKRPAPQLQCSSTTRTTSRPPRTTRRRSAATSEPHRAGFCAMTTRRSRSAPDRWPRGTCTLVRPPTCSRPPTTRNARTVSSCTSSRLSCSVGSSVRIKAW